MMQAIQADPVLNEIKQIARSMNGEQRLQACVLWTTCSEAQTLSVKWSMHENQLYDVSSSVDDKVHAAYTFISRLSYTEIFNMWSQQRALAPELLSEMDRSVLEAWMDEQCWKIVCSNKTLDSAIRTAFFLALAQYLDPTLNCNLARHSLKYLLANERIRYDKKVLFFLYLHSSENIADMSELQDGPEFNNAYAKLECLI